MRRGSGRGRRLPAAVLAGAALAVVAPALGGAGTASSRAVQADALRARAGTLEGREHAALLELYAVETRLARARTALAAVQGRLAEVRRDEASTARRHAVSRRSLAASQARVAQALRTLYVDGDADLVAVLLGATSLDEALLGIEGLSRAAEQNARLAREARERASSLRALAARLAERRADLTAAAAAAGAAAEALERETEERAATLARIAREASVERERLAELDRQAAAAGRASLQVGAARPAPGTETEPPPETEVAAAAPAAAPPAAAGPRTLVVDAVAYHLPGVTASGIPVGPGVIAVDPAVIPLGTRVFVPGYGPAVAADVGSAVTGRLIDLWMPSTAAARAWGRRTVTITIYG